MQARTSSAEEDCKKANLLNKLALSQERYDHTLSTCIKKSKEIEQSVYSSIQKQATYKYAMKANPN